MAARKPAEVRQRRNRAELTVHENPVPEPPVELDGDLREAWFDYWQSEFGQLVDPATDRTGIRRLFLLCEEWDRLQAIVREQPLVEGSRKQAVLNPLYKRITQIEKEIRMLEGNDGKNPKSRLQIGGSFAQTMKSLHELNKETREKAREKRKLRPI